MSRSPQESTARRARTRDRKRRQRRGVGVLFVGVCVLVAGIVAALLVGASSRGPAIPGGLPHASLRSPPSVAADGRPPTIVPARPGVARVVFRGPRRSEVALTFDDGLCRACVAGIVHVLQRSGAHATLFPNGRFNASWGPVAGAVKDLIKRGQLVVGNHTFTHTDPRRESADAFAKDLQRNERWIERTFGVTGRPWFRPPYGSYDHATIDAAGPLGYTRVILWSGTLADSDRRSVPYLLRAVRYWARPGVIMLMHGNYPNTARALPRILRLLALARLRPVTVAELLRGR